MKKLVKKEPRKQILYVYIRPSTYKKLIQLCREYNYSRSHIVDEMLEAALEKVVLNDSKPNRAKRSSKRAK